MGFTDLIMLFLFLLACFFVVVGINVYRNRRATTNQPTFFGISALFLQTVLILLFFSGILIYLHAVLFEIIWWGTVVYGLVIGIKEIKHNIFVALLIIFISVILAMYMALMTFITSM